jgi:hypothetical protein
VTRRRHLCRKRLARHLESARRWPHLSPIWPLTYVSPKHSESRSGSDSRQSDASRIAGARAGRLGCRNMRSCGAMTLGDQPARHGRYRSHSVAGALRSQRGVAVDGVIVSVVSGGFGRGSRATAQSMVRSDRSTSVQDLFSHESPRNPSRLPGTHPEQSWAATPGG